MAKDCQNIYRVARCLAKMQRLQAAEELAISESTLRKYEADTMIVPDDVAVKMAELYRRPWLLIQHLTRNAVFKAAFGELKCNIEDKAVNVLTLQSTVSKLVKTIPAIIESTLDGTKPNSAKICREVIQSLLPFITNEKAAGAGTPTAYRKDV